jgi:PTS system mannose-specific IIA component
MIGLIIITHGQLAVELKSAAEHVVGPMEHCIALAIAPDDDVEERRADLENALDEVDTGKGVIIVTDMFGGTPANLAISFFAEKKIEVVGGVNLPMLIKLAEAREASAVAHAAEDAVEAGKRYIAMASLVLNEKKA